MWEVREMDKNKKQEEDKKELSKQEKKLQKKLDKLEKRKPKILSLIAILSIIISVGMIYIYTGSHKDGLSWEDVLEQQDLVEGTQGDDLVEQEKEESLAGHMGGEELLILEEYKNEVSKEEFLEVKEDGEVLVYFYSKYCPYCFEFGDMIVDELENTGINYVVVEANRDVEFQEQEGIEGMPMVAKYRDGKQVDSQIGFGSLEDIQNFLGDGEVGSKED